MQKVKIIAEMACSHNGSVKRAKKIIDGGAKAKADIIQLQIWELRYLMSPLRKEFKKLKKIELKKKEWISIVRYIKKKYPKLKIYVCVYEHKSIDFIKKLKIDGIKINSSDLSNPLTLKLASKLNLPINLSVGASTINEIKKALDILKKNRKVTLMYGQQNFPTKIDDINLESLKKLSSYFKRDIGYQDHCDGKSQEGYVVPAMSLALGSRVIEKHITLDRNKKGFDYESALLPQEFKKFVTLIRSTEKAIGKNLPRPLNKSEKSYRKFQKKSIVVLKDLKKNEILKKDDVIFLRSDKLGIQPINLKTILGKKVKKNLKKYSTVEMKNFY